MCRVTVLLVDTPSVPARAHVHEVGAPRGLLVLGHGAGGGVTSRDLAATAALATSEGVSVVLVEQPYRVAGRRSPPPAPRLDAAWTAVVDSLRARWGWELPLVVGGRSSGARVACRTAAATGASGVLCLAFPLQPPQGKRLEPRPSRLPELDGVTVPTLVVQGERDAFGIPPPSAYRMVVLVPGDHGLRAGLDPATPVIRDWLQRLVTSGLP